MTAAEERDYGQAPIALQGFLWVVLALNGVMVGVNTALGSPLALLSLGFVAFLLAYPVTRRVIVWGWFW